MDEQERQNVREAVQEGIGEVGETVIYGYIGYLIVTAMVGGLIALLASLTD